MRAPRIPAGAVDPPDGQAGTFAELKYRIFEKPRYLLRRRWGAGTEMTLAVLAYNLKQALRVLGTRGLSARLAAA